MKTDNLLEQDIVKVQSSNLYSFDIFDTLITRTCVLPTGIFVIMQHILTTSSDYDDIPSFVKQNFYTLRVESEDFVRVNNSILENTQDITLRDIYREIKLNNNLSDEQTEKLIDLEIQTEIKNLKAIPKNIGILKNLVAAGKKVILVSDAYHSEDVLRKILIHVDSIFNDIKIYVSSEYGLTKSSGDLYDLISQREGVEFKNWNHWGDNINSDVKQAKHKGINPALVPRETLLPYERRGLKDAESDYSASVLIGIARYLRTLRDDKTPAYILGASYAGPVLFNYVNWIIEQAVSRNIKNLYFIARDGYVLQQIADIILKEKDIPISTRYIYGSRTAWRIPDESNIDEYISWMCNEYLDRFSLNFIADRLNISTEFMKETSGIKNGKKLLRRKEVLRLEEILLNSSEFKKRLLEINKVKKDILSRYLKQELDTSSRFAFVDILGSGKTQDMLANILKDFYSDDVYGFYLNASWNRTEQKTSKKITYLPSKRYSHFIIELLCRNLEGQTIGYEMGGDNKIYPVLEDINTSVLLEWGYHDYIQGLHDFIHNACQFEKENNLSLCTYTLFKNYHSYGTGYMDRETADIIGSIPYRAVGREAAAAEAAPKIDLRNFIKFAITGKLAGFVDCIAISRSSGIFKYLVIKFKKYGSGRKWLLNVYLNKSKKRFCITFLGIKLTLSGLIWRKPQNV